MLSDCECNYHVTQFILRGTEPNLKASLCIVYFPVSRDRSEIVNVLHPYEMKYYKSLQFENRRKSYLVGRLAAKKAVSALIGEQNLETILIRQGIFGQPILSDLIEQNIQVSISHSDNFGAGLAFPEDHPLGIDIEKVTAAKRQALESQITEKEKKMISNFLSYDEKLTVFWSCKEALSKIFKTGLTAPFEIFEISKIEQKKDALICYFKNFIQYKAISFDVGFSVCSIVLPKKTEITLDISAIKKEFDSQARINVNYKQMLK